MSGYINITEFYKNNLAVLPIQIFGKDKKPACKSEDYTSLHAKQGNPMLFKEGGAYGIGVFGGAISGSLEILDFDTKHDSTGTLWEDFLFNCEMLDISLDKYLIAQTLSKGYHIYYRCEVIDNNKKIAYNETGKEAIIETRGEGGWVAAPPTKGYEILQGSFATIPTITIEERKKLWFVCELFDMGKKEVEKKVLDKKPTQVVNENNPFAICNAANPLPMLLQEGWKEKKGGRGETIYLIRPGSKSKTPHATLRPIGDTWLFHCFTSNGYPFEMKSYNPVGIFACFNGITDSKELGQSLAKEGFGKWNEPIRKEEKKEYTVPPKPEQREVTQGDFPLHVFPQKLQGFIREYSEKENMDKNCLALCVMGAFSTAIGLNYSLEYANGYQYHASFYGAMVGNSAVGKSPILKLAYAPLYDLEKEWYKEYKEELISWKKKNSAKGGTEEEMPTRKRCIVEDSTIEAVLSIMQDNQKGLGMTHDELSGWLSSFNKYNKGSGDGKRWLEMWSNNRVSKDRVSGSLYVPKGYCTIVGGIQPTEMGELVRGSFANDGFFFRFLFAFASKNNTVRTWQEMKQRTTDGRLFIAYKEALQKIASEAHREMPATYQLDSEEEEYWANNWYNPYQYENHAVAEHNPSWSSVLTKMSIYCSRFQLLLQLIHEAYGADSTGFISMDSVKGAIDLTNYFKSNFKVAMSMANEAQGEAQGMNNSKAESVKWVEIFGEDIELQRKDIVERLIAKYGTSEPSAKRWIANALTKTDKYGFWTYL